MRQERALLDPEDTILEMKIAKEIGYGGDPNLITPSTPWQLTLSEEQLQLIDALSDIILPGDDDSPDPSAVPISAFFNDWLSAPYSKQKRDRSLIASGLRRIDDYARANYGAGFLELTLEQRAAIVEAISVYWPVRPFFDRFRYLLIGGYFTSPVGFSAIGYVGNVPLEEYPVISDELAELVEDELDRLGL